MSALVAPVLKTLAQLRSRSQPELVTSERIPIVVNEGATPFENVLERHGCAVEALDRRQPRESHMETGTLLCYQAA